MCKDDRLGKSQFNHKVCHANHSKRYTEHKKKRSDSAEMLQ